MVEFRCSLAYLWDAFLSILLIFFRKVLLIHCLILSILKVYLLLFYVYEPLPACVCCVHHVH